MCMLFQCDYFLVWMGVIEIFVDMSKNFRISRYAFLFTWKLQVNKVRQKHLLYTSILPFKFRFSPASVCSWSPIFWLWTFLSSSFIKLKWSTFSKTWIIFSKLPYRLLRLILHNRYHLLKLTVQNKLNWTK